ncbi:hypothetical protein RB200_41270 [Streptomyces sp. PmtG]
MGNPTNTGDNFLMLVPWDRNGRMTVGRKEIAVGQSLPWYHAPAGAVAISVHSGISCSGLAQLTYDTPNT